MNRNSLCWLDRKNYLVILRILGFFSSSFNISNKKNTSSLADLIAPPISQGSTKSKSFPVGSPDEASGEPKAKGGLLDKQLVTCVALGC